MQVISSTQLSEDSQNDLSSPEAIKQFSGFFELLSKIDRRLKEEDLEYKEKYYENK